MVKTTKVKLKRKDIDEVKKAKIETVDVDGQTNEMRLQVKRKNKDRTKFLRTSKKERKLLKKYPEHTYLITMFFLNGTNKTFFIKTDEKTFKLKKKLYYLAYEEAWYDITQRHYHLFYVEDGVVPINREIVKHAENEEDERFFSITPSNIKPLIDFEYVKVLAQSQQISKILKTLLVVAFISGGASIVTLLVTLQQSGVFSGKP